MSEQGYTGVKVSTYDVEVGDRVGRVAPGATEPMWLTVTEVDEDTIHCNLWTFDRASGAEIDHDQKWGPEYGVTGSHIRKIVKGVKTDV